MNEIEKYYSKEDLQTKLLDYKCILDKNIEQFLNFKALEFEDRGGCSTYLLVDEEKFYKEDKLEILGFFSLSNVALEIPVHISNTLRKRLLNGLNKSDSYMHFILIGQLGKYMDEQMISETNIRELLDQAFDIIYQVKKRITCHCVLLECKNEEKLCHLYESYGFKKMQCDQDMIQYIKFI